MKCQSQTARLSLEGCEGAACSHPPRGLQKQCDKKASYNNISWLLPDNEAYYALTSEDKKKTNTHKRCIRLGNKNNNSCLVKVFNTSFSLRSVFTVQADRNQVLLLTSASPAVTLPLFIITAAEEEEVWGAQPPCLPPPDRTRHAAVMRSDTSAWMSCC